MSEKLIYPVPEAISKTANIDDATYQRLYRQSLDDPEGFWAEQAQRLDWIEPWQTVKETSFQRNGSRAANLMLAPIVSIAMLPRPQIGLPSFGKVMIRP